MIHIGELKPWDLYSMFTQKYFWTEKNAREFADFLTPMLDYNTKRRVTAYECLHHEWIQISRIEPDALNNNSNQDSPTSTSSCLTFFNCLDKKSTLEKSREVSEISGETNCVLSNHPKGSNEK